MFVLRLAGMAGEARQPTSKRFIDRSSPEQIDFHRDTKCRALPMASAAGHEECINDAAL